MDAFLTARPVASCSFPSWHCRSATVHQPHVHVVARDFAKTSGAYPYVELLCFIFLSESREASTFEFHRSRAVNRWASRTTGDGENFNIGYCGSLTSVIISIWFFSVERGVPSRDHSPSACAWIQIISLRIVNQKTSSRSWLYSNIASRQLSHWPGATWSLKLCLILFVSLKNLHFALVSPGLIIVSIIAYVGWPCAGHLMWFSVSSHGVYTEHLCLSVEPSSNVPWLVTLLSDSAMGRMKVVSPSIKFGAG